MVRKRTLRLSTRQQKLMGKEKLAELEALGCVIKTKGRTAGEERADVEDRKRPLPPANFTACYSCPVCGELFHVKALDLKEAGQESRAKTILHLVQDHQWKGPQINEWVLWIAPGSVLQGDGREKELQENDASAGSWQDTLMDPSDL